MANEKRVTAERASNGIAVLAVASAALTVLACGGAESMAGPEPAGRPGPGTRLTRELSGGFAWSADGSEIFFVESPRGRRPTRIVSREVRSGSFTLRTVVPGVEHFKPGQLLVSPDGAWLYFSARDRRGGNPRSGIYRVATGGGSPELLAGGGAGGPVLSPDGRLLAWGRDSVRMLDVVSRTIRDISFLGEPLDFSPGGSRLLVWGCPPGGTCVRGLYEIDVESGSAREVVDPTEEAIDPPAHVLSARWDASGIRMVVADFVETERTFALFLRHVTEGRSTRLVMEGEVGTLTRVRFGGWSPDGSVGTWKVGCGDSYLTLFGGEQCNARGWRSALYRFDARGRSPRIAAIAAGRGARNGVRFSPDGSNVAYRVDDGLWVHPLP